jgi:hypothetical protein
MSKKWLYLAPLLSGCVTEPASLGETEQEVASVISSMEWTITSPWRLEPPYGAIPITIAFHDADAQYDQSAAVPLKRFCGASVVQLVGVQTGDVHYAQQFAPSQFHELEAHAKWPNDSDPPLFHRLVKVWAGQQPTNEILDISTSSDWTATLMYTPAVGRTAGNDVTFQVTVVVSDTTTCPALPTALGYHPSSLATIRLGGPMTEARSGAHVFRQLLQVRYGDAPLPKFDSGYVYGDLHHHSQGTDNEGESGLAYRSTLQAMKAMGLDFVFATEHASDSDQLTSVDRIFAEDLGDFSNLPGPVAGVASSIEAMVLGWIEGYALPFETEYGALRDMSLLKFGFYLDWLHGAGGVNREVLSTGGTRAPQIFLGGEVDAIPEMTTAEKNGLAIKYGNGLSYPWRDACFDLPSIIVETLRDMTTYEMCPQGGIVDLAVPTPEGTTWKLKDIQGLLRREYARQHFLHLPTDPTRGDAFVTGDTGQYGGASRRFKDFLASDYAMASKGVFFLAHPVDAAEGAGIGRLGPDIVPYSDVQLRTVFDAPSFLGLQLWNEDTRVVTAHLEAYPRLTFMNQEPVGGLADALWNRLRGWRQASGDHLFHTLSHGAKTWDRMLLWGLDPNKRPSWVPVGQPRKVFMAGGSDAHGDLNHRQVGAMTGMSAAVDTAIGSPRNLVYVGAQRPVSLGGGVSTIGQTQVTDALRSGNFSVTDGPIVRIAIDANGSGVIDAGDVPMGGLYTWYGAVPLLVEWKSTPEFGPVNEVNLYVGTFGAGTTGQVYAPAGHGVRGQYDPSNVNTTSYLEPSGAWRKIFHDGYVLDTSGALKVVPTAGQQYGGTRLISLTPSQYKTFTGTCQTTEECEYDPEIGRWCSELTACATSTLRNPERLYVRAVVKASDTIRMMYGDQLPVTRLGYTNPIWLKPSPVLPPKL